MVYEVQVPAGTEVVTRSESGETRIEGVRGAVSVRTQSGAITLANLGETLVETGSGAVSVDGAGPLSVTTSSSGITATRLGAGLYVRTESGRVTASFDDEGDADVATGSSAITVDGLHGGFVAVTRSGRVRISGNPSRPWRVTTGSSAIEAEFDARAHSASRRSPVRARRCEPKISRCEGKPPRAGWPGLLPPAVLPSCSPAAADPSPWRPRTRADRIFAQKRAPRRPQRRSSLIRASPRVDGLATPSGAPQSARARRGSDTGSGGNSCRNPV